MRSYRTIPANPDSMDNAECQLYICHVPCAFMATLSLDLFTNEETETEMLLEIQTLLREEAFTAGLTDSKICASSKNRSDPLNQGVVGCLSRYRKGMFR